VNLSQPSQGKKPIKAGEALTSQEARPSRNPKVIDKVLEFNEMMKDVHRRLLASPENSETKAKIKILQKIPKEGQRYAVRAKDFTKA
jgi:hypothetical protein